MRIASKTSVGAALILIALLSCYAGYAGTPALAQEDVPPGYQYDSPPAGTVPLPEEQYDAPIEDQNGGTNGDDEGTALPVDDDNGDDDNGDSESTQVGAPERRQTDSAPPGYLDGILTDAAALLAVLSVVTTIFFFVERSGDRPVG